MLVWNLRLVVTNNCLRISLNLKKNRRSKLTGTEIDIDDYCLANDQIIFANIEEGTDYMLKRLRKEEQIWNVKFSI